MKRLAAVGVVLVVAITGACGGDSTPLEAAGTTVPSPAGVSTSVPGTVPDLTTTAPPPPTPPSTPAPAAPPATSPGPEIRTAARGQDFLIAVGESVAIAGTGLTITYVGVLEDSRCPTGVQCIWAGNATISITLAQPGSPPATVPLNTMEGPTSGGYSGYTVELVDLYRGAAPAATLRVT
ncbi:MAG: hypothetical protein QOE93_2025 [Actinomycetota bacterium]|nr:hypothetical protein [Actinomycetota bacterium]